MNNIDSILKEVKTVQAKTGYWLVRTMGGDYYKEYTSNEYIAIGFNEISIAEIKQANSYGKKASEQLKLMLEAKRLADKQLDDEKDPGYAANQMLNFYNKINVGDLIVIPGKNSDYVAIARAESEVYEEQNIPKLPEYCQFKKRRRIKVLKKLYRSRLNPKMLQMFSSHHIISDVSAYAEYIDNSVSDFYSKDDVTYLVLRVKEENNLRALDFGVTPGLIQLLGEFVEENQIENIDVNQIKGKMCVQSPGDILMFATSPGGLTLIGLFIFFLTGGKIESNKENWLKMEGGNIFKAVSEFLDRRRERKFLKTLTESLKNMKIETPDDFTKIMEEFNKRKG